MIIVMSVLGLTSADLESNATKGGGPARSRHISSIRFKSGPGARAAAPGLTTADSSTTGTTSAFSASDPMREAHANADVVKLSELSHA